MIAFNMFIRKGYNPPYIAPTRARIPKLERIVKFI